MYTCSTVNEAIELYQNCNEEGFSHAQIMVADRFGNSVIMDYRNGSFFADKNTDGLQVIGFEKKQAREVLLSYTNTPYIDKSTQALDQARQHARPPTQYSNICDLKNLKMWIFDFREASQ